MRKFLFIILFPAVFIADSIIAPVVFNSRGGFLTVILLLSWTVFNGVSKRGFPALIAFFILEVFWGLNWGVLSLPFALILVLFFVASEFLNVGYAGFMQNNPVVRILSLAVINSGLFYVFYVISRQIENLVYAVNFSALRSFLSDWGGVFQVFVLSAVFLSLFEAIKNYPKHKF